MTITLAANSISGALSGQTVPLLGWEISDSTALIIAAIIHAVLLFHVFALCPFFLIWLERKGSGRIQDRLGPTRVGGKFGWLQSLADGIKLIQKEDLCPPVADKMLFNSAPYIVCLASFAAFTMLPFSHGWVAVSADCGLFILLAILSLEVFGIIMAGYSSGSKWSLFGGMREAAQMVSYEIPLAIGALIPVLSAGSLNLGEIGDMQAGGFGNWFIFRDPFTFVAFFVFFIVATAGCKRAPFDLAEAESELVGGFHTEYSGMRWSFFFMGEYASMFAVCGIASILFLGGWHTGLPFIDGPLQDLRAQGAASGEFFAPGYLANVLGAGVFISKAALFVFVQIWVRWTLPRLRIDQVITTCLKYLLPISCVLFLGAAVWPLVFMFSKGITTSPIHSPLGERVAAGHVTTIEGSTDSQLSPSAPAEDVPASDGPVDGPADEAASKAVPNKSDAVAKPVAMTSFAPETR
ncbi:NADH-quinone oxidoreductase subunit NuoH [Fuerstiella marisgermanici]|uniref:NADH-quinone oxidoreductase subunit H n=1 Tax=Fuerstiella marisgermanici TaxID=1891926 RepID=A0A1P8WG46_9PLAN|nr:NADH-quinone oxidoreductase subunit NuoH [Fuerstiella marisgermanici]APZ93028.1 NADH-quinone oxidoreductase subunit H [Fuerstiella marisgermanici]